MAKMSRSNVKARKWMEANNFKDIFFTPHTRWSKDIIFQGLEFDGLASVGISLVLFQVKSNSKCPKKTLEQYKQISEMFGISCLWINAIDGGKLEVNNVSTFY